MAAPAPVVNGVPVNFGFTVHSGDTDPIKITGVSGTILQNAELTNEAECETTRNGVGAQVAHGWYDFRNGSSLEWVVSGSNLAAAITNSAIMTAFKPGAFLVVEHCDSMPELVGTWEVQTGAKNVKSNTGSAKISVPIKLFGGITAVAT